MIKRLDRVLLTSHLIATPNDVAELLLAGGLVEKPEPFRPNLVEDDATRRGLDDARFLVAVNGVLTKIRILQPDAVVRFDRAVGHREFDFRRVFKQRLTGLDCDSRGEPGILMT